jgi:DNA-binding NarL/FixJ family response regulator
MPPPPRLRVAVASDQALVAEAIAAALAGRSFDVEVLPWSATMTRSRGPDVALLLSDLDRPARIRAALRILVRVEAPWVVLAGTPRGPVWGALLEGGATIVAPVSTGLDEVAEMLRAVASGYVAMGTDDRRELVAEWRGLKAQQEAIAARIATMTPRETEVLRLLYAGTSVRDIATRLGVAESTVRSQVRRILRRLEVPSQMAAVAALSVLDDAESIMARPARSTHRRRRRTSDR